MGVTTIQVDFNHPGSPSLRLSPCHGMLLPRSPCQWFWRSNIPRISSHKLKPATPKATTIHPPTHPLPPLPLQRGRRNARRLCFFLLRISRHQRGLKGTNIILEDRGQYLPGFFLFNRCAPSANVGWPISNFPISGRLQHRYIPITKRR